MGFNGLDADAQVVSDLFVQSPGHNSLQDLCLTRGQLGHQRVSGRCVLVVRKRQFSFFKHLFHQGDEFVLFKGLLNKIHGTFFHGVYGHGHIAVARDEDHGKRGIFLDQLVLKL